MSQENLQTVILQKVWGLEEVYYGIVQVLNKSRRTLTNDNVRATTVSTV